MTTSHPNGSSNKTPLQAYKDSVQSCTDCVISNYCKHKVLYRSVGSPQFYALLIGEAPGQSEYACKQPFVGPAGHELNAILYETLEPRKLSYTITNAVLCTPFSSPALDSISTPSLSEVTKCRRHLVKYIDIVRPKVVICLGKVATRAYKPLVSSTPYISVMHPSGILQSSHPELERKRAILAINELLDSIQ